ncbi:crotonase/enoyl-CoA hydratase family protein [Sneathiella sp.]|uniref:crotonase/enoyl-CoA hydratase family protein n=1 Tax=Sneathiella sp. TaxID=1964365 RepID=UPI002605BBA9|nr:crotonase/enoyl-CoA hydratase family protein [Sneathiella sp.]MDF2366682.1 crotonase/enoyl-CoA hydratase family protein [Sneathiella sp.]
MTTRTTLEILEGGIASITLDDGKVNAMSTEMLAEIGAQLDKASEAAEVAVLSGREGIFSAGFDLAVLGGGQKEKQEMVAAGFRLVEKFLTHPQPIIVACTGHAYPMGAFLMLSSDIRIGAHGNWRMGLNEVAIKLTVPHFALELARHRLTPPAFAQITTATMFGPEAACRAGYLDDVVEPEKLQPCVFERAANLVKMLDKESYIGTKARLNAKVLSAIREGAQKDGLIN